MRKLLSTIFDEFSQGSHKIILAEVDIGLVIIFVKWRLVAFPDLLHPNQYVVLHYQLLRSLFEDDSHAISTQTSQFAASVLHEPVEKHHQVAPIG